MLILINNARVWKGLTAFRKSVLSIYFTAPPQQLLHFLCVLYCPCSTLNPSGYYDWKRQIFKSSLNDSSSNVFILLNCSEVYNGKYFVR